MPLLLANYLRGVFSILGAGHLALCGILAPVLYVFTVILGGAISPEYSHVSQAVSDLIATDAPNKPLLDALFAIYNLLAIAFAFSLLQYVRSDNQSRRRLIGTIGALL
jgi:hypothetical membrane protein